ncbi:MAG TPA: glycosyltransferase family 4 protein [Thermoguttaceae bacterium]|nr:glycosyltransferase family 4 protein [Thermoguttaceae bacterium]
MDIGLVIDYFDPHRGGAEHWTYQFAQCLTAGGHTVHVITQSAGHVPPDPGLHIHPLGRIASRLQRAEAAESKLRSLQLDLIHDIGMGWYCDVLQSEDGSRLAQWERKLRLLPSYIRPIKRLLIHWLPRYREFRRLMDRQFGEPRRTIVAVSRMCAADYHWYHRVSPHRIRLVYHGTDIHRFSPEHRPRWREPVRTEMGIAPQEVVYLFVGHDYLRKGLATAIRAVGRLVREGLPVRLLVVGGNGAGKYQRLARRWDAGGAVLFVGRVEDPVPYYAAADVFVLPTFYDPCSLSVTEAAACGLPSITTRWNGASELLCDGEDGYVLQDPADDVALADRMARLIDPRVRERMGGAARLLALEYPLERNYDEIQGVYREIRSKRKAA